ncbi:type II toxin-antitoxin system VapC family toxin [Leptolyngbya sp. CCNP1308]|uniref:type II toxin-antitoxin system VapC family toxin n=1 Tax=Leptolyngbya sp. CCNP1308 TaxID=3110255 RepID=UPI002B206F7E|nr:type II toxin-antitoxin system VapC family toxin [Leptolyngbya sp. CCNP1308]MEA5450655.1 type II toxin-antitoxin system VapC family toxin [Leptolyngbya sp. CCNP1308]
MIAVDTNIIVRLITQDDEAQHRASIELFQKPDIFIPDTVILETEWVLRFAYGFKANEICAALRKLFGLPNVYLANENLTAQILQWYENGLDFAAALHLATSQHCSALYTFDNAFVKRAKTLTDQQVQKP